jgi:hypothetical protein
MSINEEVEKVVIEMTKNRRLFTAHDVTKLVRHSVDGENVRHNDVKKEVHSLFDNDEMGIYERTQVRLGSSGSPFVYHLNHQDPNQDYNKDWVNTTIKLSNSTGINPIDGTGVKTGIPAIKTVGVKPVASDTSNVGYQQAIYAQVPTSDLRNAARISKLAKNIRYALDSGYRTCLVTKEGRLNIPIKMLTNITKANLSVLDDVVNVDGEFVKALVISNNSNNAIKSYIANTDGRVRISKKFLSKLGSSDGFRVKNVGSDVIIIED